MEELKFLNFFNRLMVSPTFAEGNSRGQRCVIRDRNLYWNALVLTTLLFVCCAGLLKQVLDDIYRLRSNVLGMVMIMLYTTLVVVIVPLIMWPFFYKRNLVDLANRAVEIDQSIPFNDTTSKCVGFLLLKMHIASASGNLIASLCVNCYRMSKEREMPPLQQMFVIYGFPVLAFIITIHQGYTQLWPVFIARQLSKLVRQTKAYQPETIQTILALSNKLEELTELFASIFGPMQVAHLLRIFVVCCAHSYYLVTVMQAGFGLRANVIELIVSLGSFFMYMYFFEECIKKVSNLSENMFIACHLAIY
ncbi:AGAP006143-PD-like protein [Anopheles sinensis]|uniref:Gustatory receptor n=1 Tax=Anopheles sinensis TaxID=74873 RepID=A0A084WEQ1_ANOSI|nr:AGAP006143-PD-like protein [Anopheles sinensis]